MLDAVGASLPIAVGVALSPLPIVAVVLMLVSGSARANAAAFLISWFVAVGAVTAVVAVAASGGADDGSAPASWHGWTEIVLGAVLVGLAVRQWRGRPRAGVEPETPRWMAAVDSFTPARAAALAALLGGINPKNLLLSAAGGAAIATAAAGETTAAVGAALVFALVASVGVATPVAVYLAAGERAAAILEDLRRWLVQHNAVIMAVLLLVIGTKLVGDGLTIV